MNRDTVLFLVKPDGPSEGRELAIGVVTMAGDPMTVRFDEELELPTGVLVTIFFREQKRFMRQTFRVQAARKDDDGNRVYRLRIDSDPIDGEERQSLRVSTVFEAMLATVAGEINCMMIDISEKGLALIASVPHKVGAILPYEMWIGSILYNGHVEVRSVAPAERGRYRYGLECQADGPGENLCRCVRQVWVDLQVKYLQGMPI